MATYWWFSLGSSLLCSLIQLVAFSLTLRKVLSGTRFKVLLQIITMFILQMLSTIITVTDQILIVDIFLLKKSENLDLKAIMNVIQSVGEGFTALMNCEAHWLLAYYYYKLAVETPELYAEQADKEAKKKHRLCC